MLINITNSGKGMSLIQHLAITWTNKVTYCQLWHWTLSSMLPFSAIWIKILKFYFKYFKEMYLKMSAIVFRPKCFSCDTFSQHFHLRRIHFGSIFYLKNMCDIIMHLYLTEILFLGIFIHHESYLLIQSLNHNLISDDKTAVRETATCKIN